MAEAMCTLAPSNEGVDTLTKLDQIFTRFWSRLHGWTTSSKHQDLTGGSPSRVPSGDIRKRVAATPSTREPRQKLPHSLPERREPRYLLGFGPGRLHLALYVPKIKLMNSLWAPCGLTLLLQATPPRQLFRWSKVQCLFQWDTDLPTEGIV
ncbi:Hypothetical predicted protein [Pelobates cultripes]|uniref:Uncharacterized protein n=1 Tax=Pelobates cultripes TaxID=61616 RepID=A0AAD1SS58_PELCU|nr:Hypothetical predicted protein [Pelobates cultripes]